MADEVSALAKAVSAQNRLAQPAANGPPMVRVQVLVAGVYNGPTHRRLPACAAGAVIDTAPAYGAQLVAEGLARWLTVEAEPASAPVAETTTAKTRAKRQR